ncbi:MAG: cyclic nucleotide-binding domain-containing protein [Deltaproteobacteria bacterium]|nr:cyclic nucleotide-binding domain-containing protein [Deltaproteobacteria bacterium]
MATKTAKRGERPAPPSRTTLRRAIKGLHQVVKRKKNDVRSMVRLARAHRLLGNDAKSARWYTVAIRLLSQQGHGLRALALAKERLAVAPEDQESLLELASLYAKHPDAMEREQGRVALPLAPEEDTSVGRIPRDFTATSAKALKILDDADEVERIHAALEAAFADEMETAPRSGGRYADQEPPPEQSTDEERALSAAEDNAAKPPPLPPRKEGGQEALEAATLGGLPLLSSLGQGAFMALMRDMERITLEDEEVLFAEGEKARSFFIVAEGALEARSARSGTEALLARLTEGEVIGVLGLYSGRRRNATVSADGPAVVFEVTDRLLSRLVKQHPAAKQALATFYRQRLLETFLGSCPLIQDLPRAARLSIVDSFEETRHPEGSLLVAPGEVQNSLHLVLRGRLEVESRLEGERHNLAHLERGDFFGCIAALTGTPSRDRARWSEEGLAASLSQKQFSEIVKRHPALRALPRVLAERGLMVSRTLFVGETGVPGFKREDAASQDG